MAEQSDKRGIFKATDGWRYRHYGPTHDEGKSAGPFPTRDAAMVALLTAFSFPVEDEG